MSVFSNEIYKLEYEAAYWENEARDFEAVWKRDRPILDGCPKAECAARKQQGTSGGNDPADCNWPFCDCDPHAAKVIAALAETGWIIEPTTVDRLRAVMTRLYDDRPLTPDGRRDLANAMHAILSQ